MQVFLNFPHVPYNTSARTHTCAPYPVHRLTIKGSNACTVLGRERHSPVPLPAFAWRQRVTSSIPPPDLHPRGGADLGCPGCRWQRVPLPFPPPAPQPSPACPHEWPISFFSCTRGRSRRELKRERERGRKRKGLKRYKIKR